MSSPARSKSAPSTPRGKRTRAALAQAGRELLEERGFAAMSIDDVAQRAGVSHGTFYTHFESKEALLREIAHVVVGEMFVANLPTHGAHVEPYARIETANREYLAAWRRGSKIIRLIDQLAGSSEQYRQLLIEMREVFVSRGAEGIRRLQEADLIDTTLNPRLTAIALGAMVEQFAHVWLDLGEGFSDEEVVDHLTRLWAGAIGLEIPST
jgi:AcrR family transcriptional regulator